MLLHKEIMVITGELRTETASREWSWGEQSNFHSLFVLLSSSLNMCVCVCVCIYIYIYIFFCNFSKIFGNFCYKRLKRQKHPSFRMRLSWSNSPWHLGKLGLQDFSQATSVRGGSCGDQHGFLSSCLWGMVLGDKFTFANTQGQGSPVPSQS